MKTRAAVLWGQDQFDLAMCDKQIRATTVGSGSSRAEIPRLLGGYRRDGLELDEPVTGERALDGIDHGYQDVRDGKDVRGVIAFDR